jgi:PIN domain nuclease of toxin-antitoxin system
MRLLLDTHAFIWFVDGNSKLSSAARAAIDDVSNAVYLSVASAWELAILVSLKRITLQRTVKEYVAVYTEKNAIDLLPVTLDHIGGIVDLPFHHRDPFDRLLIAQAKSNDLTLVSADNAFEQYKVNILW